MSGFEHDKLLVLLQNINLRTEKHGEEDQLAIDVRIWVAPGEGGDQWEAILADLIGGGNLDPADWVSEQSNVLDALPFARHWEEHICNFWVGTDKVAGLTHAKINRFKMEFATDKHDDRIVFRVQAEADGKTVGALSEYIGQKLRLETVKPQGELDLDEQDEAA